MQNDEIAGKIRQVRKERGMTQADIASFLNKTAATVSDVERGKIQVSATDLYTLAHALNKPIEYFYGEEYASDEIENLIALIRKQSPEQQEKVIQQTEMLLALQMFSDQADANGNELTDEEISQAIKSIFAFADEIESMYLQVDEIRKNLRTAFKAQGINEADIIK